MQQTIATTESLDESLRAFNVNISELGGNDGALVQAAVGLKSASAAIAEQAAAVGNAIKEMGDIATATVQVGDSLKTMRSVAKKASEQLDALGSASTKLDEATNRICRRLRFAWIRYPAVSSAQASSRRPWEQT